LTILDKYAHILLQFDYSILRLKFFGLFVGAILSKNYESALQCAELTRKFVSLVRDPMKTHKIDKELGRKNGCDKKSLNHVRAHE